MAKITWPAGHDHCRYHDGLAPPKTSARDGLTTADEAQIVERRKKRVKGGSGCDDRGDVAEHPECR